MKLSKVAEGPESRVPWLGEHTDAVLPDELGLDAAAIDALVADGVITLIRRTARGRPTRPTRQ